MTISNFVIQGGTICDENTVVSRFSGLRFSGLSRFRGLLRFSGLFLLLVQQQKWSNHTIGVILFSGLSRFSGLFCGDGLSPLNRDATVYCTFGRLS